MRMLLNLLPKALLPTVLSQVPPRWPQQQFLRSFLKRLEVDCVIDVGANIGQYGAELRSIGYRGLIVSFEPAPEPFRELKRRASKDARWAAFNVALGERRSLARLNLMARSVFNSFRTPSSAETQRWEAANTVVGSADVRVETLAEVLPRLSEELKFKRPFLKMDTQGYDLEVFRGAGPALNQIVGMQSELSVKRIYDNVPDWRVVLAEYENASFQLADLYKVNPHVPVLIELDCYLERDSSSGPAGAATSATETE